MLHDLRHALRALARAPGFTLAATLTLAIGLGGVTALFGLLYASVIRPVPFDQPDRLVMLYLTERAGADPVRIRWSSAGVRILKQSARSFDTIGSFSSAEMNVSGVEDPLRVHAELADADYFKALGVQPRFGRAFSAAAAPGEPAEALISFDFWRQHLGGSSDALGRAIRVNDHPMTIVGVAPPDFRGLSGETDIWIPQTMGPLVSFAEYLTSPEHFQNVVARLRRDATLDSARAELDLVGRRVADQTEPRTPGADLRSATLLPLGDARVDRAADRTRWLLFAAAALVLAIAAVNLANLLAVRARRRQREMAIRLALGSSAWRLTRALSAEALWLGAVGVTLGLFVADWTLRALSAIAPARLPTAANDYLQLGAFAGLHLDAPVALFAAIVTLAVVTAVSLMAFTPMLRLELASSLKRGGGYGGSGRHARRGGALVALEVGLTVVLAAGAGLMLKTLAGLRAIDPGFNASGVLVFSLQEPRAFDRVEQGPALAARLLDRLSRTPGVQGFTFAQCTPFNSRCARLPLIIQGRDPAAGAPFVGWHRVGPDHFQVLGIPILRGRGFTAADRRDRPAVVVINEAAWRRFWPEQDPIGQQVHLSEIIPGAPTTAEIVGVVGNVTYWPLDVPPGPDVYQPALQFSYPWTTVMARVSGDPMSHVRDLRAAVFETDPNLPLYDIGTLDERASAGRSDRRFVAILLDLFAGLALVLAAIGIHGVTSSWLAEHRRELGIRLSLGAQPADLVRLTVGRTMGWVIVGLGAGLIAALGGSHVLRALLFDVAPSDPTIMMVAVALALTIGLASAYAPARHAARVDPVAELKSE